MNEQRRLLYECEAPWVKNGSCDGPVLCVCSNRLRSACMQNFAQRCGGRGRASLSYNGTILKSSMAKDMLH